MPLLVQGHKAVSLLARLGLDLLRQRKSFSWCFFILLKPYTASKVGPSQCSSKAATAYYSILFTLASTKNPSLCCEGTGSSKAKTRRANDCWILFLLDSIFSSHESLDRCRSFDVLERKAVVSKQQEIPFAIYIRFAIFRIYPTGSSSDTVDSKSHETSANQTHNIQEPQRWFC